MRNGCHKLPKEIIDRHGYTPRLWAYIYALDNEGVSVRELAHLFDIKRHAAHAIYQSIYGVMDTSRTLPGQSPDTKPNGNAGLGGKSGQSPDTSRTLPGQGAEHTALLKAVKEVKEVKNKKNNYSPLENFELPNWVPIDPWRGWMEVRKAKKAANTTNALNIAIKHLSILKDRGFNVGECLERAIVQNWTGIQASWFDDKPAGKFKDRGSAGLPVIEEDIAL